MMETVKKYAILVGVLGFLFGIVSGIFNFGMKTGADEEKMFDSSTQKHEVVGFVEDSPSPEQQQYARIMDSINTSDAIRSRAERDSLLKSEIKARKKTDSVNILNADQMYQIKEQLKRLEQ